MRSTFAPGDVRLKLHVERARPVANSPKQMHKSSLKQDLFNPPNIIIDP